MTEQERARREVWTTVLEIAGAVLVIGGAAVLSVWVAVIALGLAMVLASWVVSR